MAAKTVEFTFVTGLPRRIFRNARLRGSWDTGGRYAGQWTESPMTEGVGDDGCPVFTARVTLDLADADRTFHWGVVLDGPHGANAWGIPTEIGDVNSVGRYRSFRLEQAGAAAQVETYRFNYGRFLGAHKVYAADGAPPDLRFAVWAPHARAVAVVFGLPDHGYIDDHGNGIDPAQPVIALAPGDGGIWQSPVLPDFAAFMGRPYMYRIVNAQGDTVYRTDIFSRCQIGRGAIDPAREPWLGTPASLNGAKGCSVVVDQDVVNRDFADPTERIPLADFWAHELTPALPVPGRIEDLVIYELHVGALGFGKADPGDLGDALAFLDHLVALGVNAVELLPMAEFSGEVGWGYGDTHHFVVQTSAGGRDEYLHFVRACHQRGIAVIQDVVYNHYDGDAERAEWQYDSIAPEENGYYWYEGRSTDYPHPDGGYLNNGSSGYTPRFWEEVVREQFISSAAVLIEELHVDGLRVDLTQAMHRDNTLNANGSPVPSANIFGQKLLREWSRTLRMIRPNVMLIAEDHSGWDAVTKAAATGGLGFDATWYALFYHNLIGDDDAAGGTARLLKAAGTGGDEPLDLAQFSGVLHASWGNKVVYHESHDEAGNASGTARTIVTAVNGAPLWGATRVVAEARSRVVFGLSLLSAGTPMFFMGEEIGAQQPYRYNDFLAHREDILGDAIGIGAPLFRYYRELITLSRRLSCVRGHGVDIVHQSGANRVLAFTRTDGHEQALVVASLNNAPFANGYLIAADPARLPDGWWKEVFNSDSARYGGSNVGNAGASIPAHGGSLAVTIPANGLLVLVRQ